MPRKNRNVITITIRTEFKMSLWDSIKLRISGLYKTETFGKYLKALKQFSKEMRHK